MAEFKGHGVGISFNIAPYTQFVAFYPTPAELHEAIAAYAGEAAAEAFKETTTGAFFNLGPSVPEAAASVERALSAVPDPGTSSPGDTAPPAPSPSENRQPTDKQKNAATKFGYTGNLNDYNAVKSFLDVAFAKK